MSTKRILTYERICRQLIKAAKGAGLKPYAEEHVLEFHTGGRSFEFFCVPRGYGPPYHRRARISFFWPAEQHVQASWGEEDETGERPEPDEPETASADSQDEDEEEIDDLSYIELVIDYDIVGTRDGSDWVELNRRAEAAYQLILSRIEHENAPCLHYNIGVQQDGSKFLEQCYVTYFWELDILEGQFRPADIFEEVRRILQLLIENDDSPGPSKEPPRPRFPRFSNN